MKVWFLSCLVNRSVHFEMILQNEVDLVLFCLYAVQSHLHQSCSCFRVYWFFICCFPVYSVSDQWIWSLIVAVLSYTFLWIIRLNLSRKYGWNNLITWVFEYDYILAVDNHCSTFLSFRKSVLYEASYTQITVMTSHDKWFQHILTSGGVI